MQRNISKFAKECRDLWNVEIAFRSTEYGTMKRYGAFCRGYATFHVHAHCLIRTPHMGSDGYSKFLKWGNKRWRELNNMSPDQRWAPFHDAKKVLDAREVCKYMVKADELLNLTDPELGVLYHQVRGLQLVQVMGELQQERRLMKEQGTRAVRHRKDGEDRWSVVKNWNRHSKAKRDAIRDAKADRKIAGRTGERSLNVVLAMTLPSFRFSSSVCEASVLVNNYSGAPSSLTESCSEASYISRVYRHVLGRRPQAAGGTRDGAPPLSVHNDTITVLTDFEKNHSGGRSPPKLATIP